MKDHPTIKEVIVHTGQHFSENMSSVFFQDMGIPEPDYHLNINQLSHGAMTGRMLEQIENVLLKEKPAMVIVYGDTNSTLAGALAAKKLDIKIAHVEAGLRSFNMKMPEEVNRILTDRISGLLFCPTEAAVQNLKSEGYDNFPCRIEKTGDVMYDNALFYGSFSGKKSTIIDKLNLKKDDFVLCTIHRQENTDDIDRLGNIIRALNEINSEKRIILPLHPRTKGVIEKYNLKLGFEPIEPVGYFDIIELLKNCSMVMTDSGGMQKEAYFFSKFCITIREQTEWIELVEAGVNIIAGYNASDILKAFQKGMIIPVIPDMKIYGNGNSAELICDIIEETLDHQT